MRTASIARFVPRLPLRALPALTVATLVLGACTSSSTRASRADAAADAGPVARTCTIAAPVPPDWRLAADGTVFRDSLHRVVVLRGVDAGGRSKFPPYVPFDYSPASDDDAQSDFQDALGAYMDRAASWGIDALRVPFTWAAVEPTQGQDDEDFLTRYDAILDAAWARGMWSVIDFHQDIYAQLFCGDGFPAWTIPSPAPAQYTTCGTGWGEEYLNDANVEGAFDRLWATGSTVQTAMLAMWDVMVARYKDRPGVLGFEVINEPGWGTQQIDAFEAGTLTAFYSAEVPHMRAEAPSSLVFIDPTGFSGTVATTGLTKPTGDGIVFAPHYYPLSGSGKPDEVIIGLTAWMNVGASWNVPTFLGEFGGSNTDTNMPSFMTAHFDAMDALGMSGTEWEYSVSDDAWNDETDGIVASDGTELPVAQAVLRPFARAIAGTAISSAYDSVAQTFTLGYAPTTDAGGVSEVSLSSRVYPKGYLVDLEGACVDATSVPGVLLLQSDPGATAVKLTITTK